MKPVVSLVLAVGALAGARVAKVSARQEQAVARQTAELPFAPAPDVAPFLSLGFREAAADLFYVRLLGYFNGEDSTGRGVADLADAVTSLDPHFHRAYDYGANAMTLAHSGVDNDVYLRALTLLERGMGEYPDDWRLPYTAGQILTQDLKTTNPVLRRAWDEKGTLLIESAIRKPGAPARVATWAAMMRTRLGQHERAVSGLKEMLLVTSDATARKRLIDELAKLENKDAELVAAEVMIERKAFERQWKAQRPDVSASMFVLVGPRKPPGFDMADLATGGRDLVMETAKTTIEPEAEVTE